MKYRKKPVVIEAIQFTGQSSINVMCNVWQKPFMDVADFDLDDKENFFIETLEGNHCASLYDWIIKGVNGEFYPIKNEIFLESYEMTDFHGCAFCFIEMPEAHFNRRYCSDICYNKARYEREGQRSTKEQRSEWYEKRKQVPGYKEKIREQARLRSQDIKKFLAEYKTAKGCTDCGYNTHHSALDFDHVRGEKEINVSLAKSIEQAKIEIEKCEVVCSNCHRIRTYERIYPCKPDIFEMTYEVVDDSL